MASVDLVVIHCTELPDLETAREYGERLLYSSSGTGACGHYYVDRDGQVEEWVPPDRVAHHVRGFNPRSVGVELVNRGRFPDWYDSGSQAMTEAYGKRQIEALINLLGALLRDLPSLRWIAGHETLDRERVEASDDPSLRVRRKVDPGPLFPWGTVLSVVPLKRFTPDAVPEHGSD